jgi:hypothetical protein
MRLSVTNIDPQTCINLHIILACMPLYVIIHNQYPHSFVNIRVILAYIHIHTRRIDNLQAYQNRHSSPVVTEVHDFALLQITFTIHGVKTCFYSLLL